MFYNLKRIYEAFSDEQSKYIFDQRLKYSLTSEQSYIRDMIKHEIDLYSEADQMFRLVMWLEKKTGQVVLFGAGFAGYQITTMLAEYGVLVNYICDNNSSLWGTKKYGIDVISPVGLAKMSKENLVIIIGVNAGREDVVKQLRDMGFEDNIFIPHKDWWLGPFDQYFDEDIISHSNSNEVFIDGGALDGGDTLRFFRWSNGRGTSYLIEPDKDNVNKIKNSMSSLGEIKVLQKGLWDSSTTLRFKSGENENSSISEDGDVEIQSVAIDEIKVCEPITFVKMDIEGSERKALIGAKKTISEYKPKLAICVYHKPEDIIDLPLLILNIRSDYKLFLRHYSYTDTETVLYAV